jgi:site-specific recombinase XerD
MNQALDPLIDTWLGGLGLSTHTIRTYRTGLADFARWATDQDLPLDEVQDGDLNRYRLHVQQQRLSHSTVDSRTGAVRNFYRWMHADGRITHNPAAKFLNQYQPKNTLTDVLKLPDLRALVEAATGAKERAVLLLMLLNGLSTHDIIQLNVSDLITDDGYRLRLAAGGYTPLPDLLVTPILDITGERKRGPLLLNEWNNRMSNHNVRRLVSNCSTRAKLGVDVSPQILTASMRDILINGPVPMTAILQSLGFGATTNLRQRVKLAPTAPQHVAFRMALLLRPDSTTTVAYFDHADGLSAHHGLPPAARVAFAGAAFELHLRLLAVREGVVPENIEKTTLGFLASRLRDDGPFSEAEFKICGIIGTTRDWAAHGWFDKVTDERANQAMIYMRQLVDNHPI